MLESKMTPAGTGYLMDFAGNDRAPLIYLHGDGESGNGTTDLNKIKNVAFFKKLYAQYQGKFNFFAPQYPSTSHGWATRGTDFIEFVLANYIQEDEYFLTGHSAGAGGVMFALNYFNAFNLDNPTLPKKRMPRACSVVAGGSDYKPTIRLNGNYDCTQIRLSVGSKDSIVTSQDKKTIYQKMQSIYTWLNKAPVWIEYPGIGHGSDQYAYDKADGLAEWFLSKVARTPVPEPEPEPGPVIVTLSGPVTVEDGIASQGGSDGQLYTWPVSVKK